MQAESHLQRPPPSPSPPPHPIPRAPDHPNRGLINVHSTLHSPLTPRSPQTTAAHYISTAATTPSGAINSSNIHNVMLPHEPSTCEQRPLEHVQLVTKTRVYYYEVPVRLMYDSSQFRQEKVLILSS